MASNTTTNVTGGLIGDAKWIVDDNTGSLKWFEPTITDSTSTTTFIPNPIQFAAEPEEDEMKQVENEAKKRTTEIHIQENEYEYTHMMLKADVAVEIFDKYDPMDGPHPSSLAMRLLKLGMGAATAYTASYEAGLGVIYHEINTDKRYNRLTAAGLAVLEHWAEKHKEFKKFFNVYVPASFRREIKEAGVDLALGQFPKGIRELIDADKERQKQEEIAQEAHDFLSYCDFHYDKKTGIFYLEYEGKRISSPLEFFEIMSKTDEYDASNEALAKFAKQIVGK